MNVGRWSLSKRHIKPNPLLSTRTLFSVPSVARTIFSFSSRIPVYIGLGVATTVSYSQYKFNQIQEAIPDWVKDSFHNAQQVFQDADPLGYLKDLLPSGIPILSDDDNDEDEEVVPENKSSVKSSQDQSEQQHNLLNLTRKMIEIRNMLKSIPPPLDDENNKEKSALDELKLPSIVVVGSQSSGKSSVLESIVGHEFLPKGSNMVTRRPIELTLIHTPESSEEYAVFPSGGAPENLRKIHDFKTVQSRLYDMNMQVSDQECVSEVPIELMIYSPFVPDLSLVDLPGYIQIHSQNQPPLLKKKIQTLCEKYLCSPNIILAISSADVDLANSTSLQASRKADPNGERTIGVITKMDLVPQEKGISILLNKEFPLKLGYVGVISAGKEVFDTDTYTPHKSILGTPVLRSKLQKTLELHMQSSLATLTDQINRSLEESRYIFKVQYNDKRVSGDEYLASVLDAFKTRFKDFQKKYDEDEGEEVQVGWIWNTTKKKLGGFEEVIWDLVEERVVRVLKEVYWGDNEGCKWMEGVCSSGKGDREGVKRKLEMAGMMVTKSGIGRDSTQLVVDLIMKNMEQLSAMEPFNHHPKSSKRIIQTCNETLQNRFLSTVEQVENSIKPYKTFSKPMLLYNEYEWSQAQKLTLDLLHTQIAEMETQLKHLKTTVGRRKLKQATQYLHKKDQESLFKLRNRTSTNPIDESTPPPFSTTLLTQAAQSISLSSQITLLKHRSSLLSSTPTPTSTIVPCYPEIYMIMLARKITKTAFVFIQLELLHEFFESVPREIERQIYYNTLRDEGSVQEFVDENPGVSKHLRVYQRVRGLEETKGLLAEVRRELESKNKKDEKKEGKGKFGKWVRW